MSKREAISASLKEPLLRRGGGSPRLLAALNDALESPGKRLRPRLVHESAALVGLPEEATRIVARSVELVHLFSLVHDDLPALDNDDFRRGLPTLHKKFGEGLALLAGDELLQMAHESFSELIPLCEPRAFGIALTEFHSAIGRDGMIGGQCLELETPPEAMSLPLLIEIQKRKTGALFRASVLLPALLAGKTHPDPLLDDLEAFAEAFGFAFQIADDLEDEEQDRGKPVKNILGFLGRKAAIELAESNLRSSPLMSRFTPAGELLEKIASK
jgi:geranylgeranyl diphosphate synthase type II